MEDTPHAQVKFFTKQSKYSVPDTPFSVPVTVNTGDLSSLINGLIKENVDKDVDIDFDFLIDGEFLRVSLEKHLEQKEVSTETVAELEYVERHPAPRPEDSLDHDDWVSCVHAANNCILSGSYDNTLHLWSAKGDALLTIPGHTQPVKCVKWIQHDPGKSSSFLSGSHDQTVLLWQWDEGKREVDCVHCCRGHAASVDCIAVNQSGDKFCSGSWDKMLKMWSAVIDRTEESPSDDEDKPAKKKKTSGPKVQTRVPILTLSGHTEAVSGVTWLGDQEVCTASWDHTLRLWDLEKAEQKSTMQGNKVFLSVSYSPANGLLVTGSADRHVRLWDPRCSDGSIVKSTYTSHQGWVSSVAWSPTNRHQFISGSYDNLMKLWDQRSPKAPLYNLVGHTDKILAVDWSIPSMLLSGGADNQLKIFQYEDVAGKKS
ncbi:ribosome biogenesis protein WDR12 homolog [Mya arenaria]|uniref:ribosome biogenesis protein WDR12 homolog n=1 Tax=Mya arenaria TaxID=6604 RepID=UPI0022E0CB4D|nr:ribosome biogenesis protein WDR12 homolog [Mya arenaria]XP_052797175.1 ribosome biogenesis protein WDR12 homolog [Mya arenaria]